MRRKRRAIFGVLAVIGAIAALGYFAAHQLESPQAVFGSKSGNPIIDDALNRNVDVDYRGASLDTVVADLSRHIGLTILVDPSVRTPPFDATTITLRLHHVPARTALKLIISQYPEYRLATRDAKSSAMSTIMVVPDVSPLATINRDYDLSLLLDNMEADREPGLLEKIRNWWNPPASSSSGGSTAYFTGSFSASTPRDDDKTSIHSAIDSIRAPFLMNFTDDRVTIDHDRLTVRASLAAQDDVRRGLYLLWLYETHRLDTRQTDRAAIAQYDAAAAHLLRPVTIHARQRAVYDVLLQIADQAGLNLVVDWRKLSGPLQPTDLVNLDVQSVPASAALDQLIRQLDPAPQDHPIFHVELICPDIILIMSPEQTPYTVIDEWRAYDVNDLTKHVIPTDSSDEFDSTGRFSTGIFSASDPLDMIQSAIRDELDPYGWYALGGVRNHMLAIDNVLFIDAPPQMHHRILQLLNQWRHDGVIPPVNNPYLSQLHDE